MLSLGFIAWCMIVSICALLTIIFTKWSFNNDEPSWGWGGVIAFLIGIPIAALGFYPFNMAYHSYRPVSGVVEKIDSRFISTGSKSTETKFVVKFAGDSQLYGCTDTRCANTKPGERLSLACIRVWQYAGVDGYDCKYNQ